MRLGQVLAARAVALEQVRHGVEPEPVEAEVEPEPHHVEHRVGHLGVLVVEVRLVVVEAVPVVLLARVVAGPVGRLDVGEDDPDVGPLWSSSVQTYQSALALSRDERDSMNHGCWSLVWFITRSAMTRMPRRWASSRNADQVVDGAALGVHGEEVADVVAAVAKGDG